MSLLEEILDGYTLDPDGVHGVRHWARVLENGLRLAPLTGADQRVVMLFALFHDSRRENDWDDPGHGVRGGALAGSLRTKHDSLIALDDDAMQKLITACSLHTGARSHPDPTVATCFDADRLDLPRCGIRVDPRRLCTPAPRSMVVITWAGTRSLSDAGDKGLAILRSL